MSALRFLDDEAVEALTLGDEVAPELAALAAFAERVRAVGDEPAPLPSLELQAMFASQAATKADRTVLAGRPVGVPGVVAPRTAHVRLAAIAGRVAGLGIAAKLALGVSVATAGVAGAGAAGALPDGADRAVRTAIEAVTPLDLGRPGDPDRAPVGPGTTPTSGGSTTSGAPGGPAGTPGAVDRDGEDGERRTDDRDDRRGDEDGDRSDRPSRRGERWDDDRLRPDDPEDGDDQGEDGDDGDGYSPARSAPASTAGPDTTSDDTTDSTTTNETTPASAPGDAPDAAGDEGTGPRQAWDADAAGSTG